jgi:hypothetical protein
MRGDGLVAVAPPAGLAAAGEFVMIGVGEVPYPTMGLERGSTCDLRPRQTPCAEGSAAEAARCHQHLWGAQSLSAPPLLPCSFPTNFESACQGEIRFEY